MPYFFYPAVRGGLMMAMMRPPWTSANLTGIALRTPGHFMLLMDPIDRGYCPGPAENHDARPASADSGSSRRQF